MSQSTWESEPSDLSKMASIQVAQKNHWAVTCLPVSEMLVERFDTKKPKTSRLAVVLLFLQNT